MMDVLINSKKNFYRLTWDGMPIRVWFSLKEKSRRNMTYLCVREIWLVWALSNSLHHQVELSKRQMSAHYREELYNHNKGLERMGYLKQLKRISPGVLTLVVSTPLGWVRRDLGIRKDWNESSMRNFPAEISWFWTLIWIMMRSPDLLAIIQVNFFFPFLIFSCF